MHEGYNLKWKAGKTPVLTDSKGKKVPLKLRGVIPVLRRGSEEEEALVAEFRSDMKE